MVFFLGVILWGQLLFLGWILLVREAGCLCKSHLWGLVPRVDQGSLTESATQANFLYNIYSCGIHLWASLARFWVISNYHWNYWTCVNWQSAWQGWRGMKVSLHCLYMLARWAIAHSAGTFHKEALKVSRQHRQCTEDKSIYLLCTNTLFS